MKRIISLYFLGTGEKVQTSYDKNWFLPTIEPMYSHYLLSIVSSERKVLLFRYFRRPVHGLREIIWSYVAELDTASCIKAIAGGVKIRTAQKIKQKTVTHCFVLKEFPIDNNFRKGG
jgi:hypothetical protein